MMTLLPPKPCVCQLCAVDHHPSAPHDQTSLHYRKWFYEHNRRLPTWADAMAHCSDNTKEDWTEALKTRGIEVTG